MFNATTSDDVLEYGWGAEIGDQKSGYQFGPVLFKPSGTATATGSLSELVEACQHTLWIVSEGGGKHAGDYGETTVEAGKVRLVITKPTLLKDLFESKPPTTTKSDCLLSSLPSAAAAAAGCVPTAADGPILP